MTKGRVEPAFLFLAILLGTPAWQAVQAASAWRIRTQERMPLW